MGRGRAFIYTVFIGQTWRTNADERTFIIKNVWRKDGMAQIYWVDDGTTTTRSGWWLKHNAYPVIMYV